MTVHDQQKQLGNQDLLPSISTASRSSSLAFNLQTDTFSSVLKVCKLKETLKKITELTRNVLESCRRFKGCRYAAASQATPT